MTTHINLPAAAQIQLEVAIRLYRKAIADLDSAINSEEWGRIHTLQGSRDLQAHTIAALVNRTTLSFAAEGGQA